MSHRLNTARDGFEPPLTWKQTLGTWATLLVGTAVALAIAGFAVKGFIDWEIGK